VRKTAAVAFAGALFVAIASCGGGGSSPTTPVQPAAPTAGSIEGTTLSVPQGAAVVFRYESIAPSFAPNIQWEVRGTPPSGATWVRVMLIREDGARCWGDTTQVAAGSTSWHGGSFGVMGGGAFFEVACGDQHSTSLVEAQFLRTTPVWGSSDSNVLLSWRGNYTLTFERTGRGSTRPTPAPPPRGGGGGEAGMCNGVPAPNSCDVGTGPPPATARCNDGLWSCSQNRQGSCSSNGGVACWVCPGPLC
jgi:hypothetical protein